MGSELGFSGSANFTEGANDTLSDDDGDVIGPAVLVVVLVVNEMEAGTESTESFAKSLVGDLNPSLKPDNIMDSLSFSTCRMMSTSLVSCFSRGFKKLILGSPSSSSTFLVRKVDGSTFLLNK